MKEEVGIIATTLHQWRWHHSFVDFNCPFPLSTYTKYFPNKK